MTIYDSYAQFLDDFLDAAAGLARSIDWYAAPEQEFFLEFERDKVVALGRACNKLLAADDDFDPGFDSEAALDVLRLVATLPDPDPDPEPQTRPKSESVH